MKFPKFIVYGLQVFGINDYNDGDFSKKKHKLRTLNFIKMMKKKRIIGEVLFTSDS